MAAGATPGPPARQAWAQPPLRVERQARAQVAPLPAALPVWPARAALPQPVRQASLA